VASSRRNLGKDFSQADTLVKAKVMRTARVLAAALAVAACTGTEGNVLRTRPDNGASAEAGSAGSIGAGGAGGTGGENGGSAGAGGDASERPRPTPLSSWQIQLSGALDTSLDVDVFIADFQTDSSVIRELHDAGRIVICYFSAGSAEAFREDAARFPESALGAELPDYPDERFVDVRDETVRAIMEDRIAAAEAAGCDGIHPSGLAAFSASTGLDFDRADQLDYNRWLAAAVHSRGLSIGLVDGDPSLTGALVGDFDWTVVWSCLRTGCPSAAPFTSAGKPALLVEYGDEARADEVCPPAESLQLSVIIKRNANLDAFRVGCP
jgi:hypothetical protein